MKNKIRNILGILFTIGIFLAVTIQTSHEIVTPPYNYDIINFEKYSHGIFQNNKFTNGLLTLGKDGSIEVNVDNNNNSIFHEQLKGEPYDQVSNYDTTKLKAKVMAVLKSKNKDLKYVIIFSEVKKGYDTLYLFSEENKVRLTLKRIKKFETRSIFGY